MDDEPQVLRLLRTILDDHGYTTFGTGNPDEMMHLLELEQPHLVLMDLMVPGTSGFELMGRVREVSDVPVIFLSANDREENVVKALKIGADDYIVKPFSSTELTARVEASLRKRIAAGTTVQRQLYRLDALSINYADRAVSVSGRRVQLSATEYKLLFELLDQCRASIDPWPDPGKGLGSEVFRRCPIAARHDEKPASQVGR